MPEDNIALKGMKIMWAKLAEPSDMSNKYQVDLVELDAATAKTLTKAGITVKHGKDKKRPQPEIGQYVVASATRPIPVVDGKRNAVTDVGVIGNGTIANVIVKPYAWTFKDKSGVGCGLQAIQIQKLVEYSGATGMFGDVEGGYEAPVKEPAKGGEMFEDDVPF